MSKKNSGSIWKILLLSGVAALVGAGYVLYQKPEVQEKVEDARWIYEHREADLYQGIDWTDGEIVKVLDGNWVYVKIKDGFVYALRIRGLEAPTLAVRLSDDTLKLGQASKKFLEELALKKPMRFQVIDMSDQRYGHGYIELNDESILFPMIKAGMARLNRSEITHLDNQTLLDLFQTEREAQKSGVGIWEPSLQIDWTVGDFSQSEQAPQL